MDEKKPKKVYLGTHVTLAGRQWLEDLAHEHRLSLSEVARVSLAVAKRHEPEVRNALKERM
jgi:hypothetical protein